MRLSQSHRPEVAIDVRAKLIANARIDPDEHASVPKPSTVRVRGSPDRFGPHDRGIEIADDVLIRYNVRHDPDFLEHSFGLLLYRHQNDVFACATEICDGVFECIKAALVDVGNIVHTENDRVDLGQFPHDPVEFKSKAEKYRAVALRYSVMRLN